MSSNGAGPSTSQHVMSVLQTLYVDPDPGAKKRAGEWLEEFQHSVCRIRVPRGSAGTEGRRTQQGGGSMRLISRNKHGRLVMNY
jgi:hypothetical protein